MRHELEGPEAARRRPPPRRPRRRGAPRWRLPESEATPESVWHGRRSLLRAAGAAGAIAGAAPLLAACGRGAAEEGDPAPDPSAHLYPAPRDESFVLDRPITPERDATTYNNFYEFGSSKRIAERAQALRIRPWQVEIKGLVERPRVLEIDDLLARVELEERLYRHRCVEAWAMAVPWTGFPMSRLLEIAEPLSSARFVRMQTLADRETMPGLKAVWYPWPYIEGLTMEEAANDLTLLATGIYGRPMPRQNGAPLRLVAPWKYGFKAIKSIVSFEFTAERPVGFWEEVQGKEYGFWANVNPEVRHPRWSQSEERMLGTNERRETLKWNGYGEEVAHLYAGMEETVGDRLFR